MFLVLVFFFCYNTDYSILFHYGIEFSKFFKTTYGILNQVSYSEPACHSECVVNFHPTLNQRHMPF